MGLFDFLKEDLNVKEYHRILQECNQALALNDKDPALWNKKCLVLTKLGRYKEAIDAGKTGVQLAPNDPELWDTLRDAYLHNKNHEKADECRKHVLDLIKQKKETESQRSSISRPPIESPYRVMKDSGKECYYCGVHVSEIIQCGPCGRHFCPDCWRDHQWVHGKPPSIGVSYQADGSFSGFDGSELLK